MDFQETNEMEEYCFDKERVITKIKAKTVSFINDKKQANNILDILKYLEDEDEEIVIASIESLELIFIKLMQNEELFIENDTDVSSAKHFKEFLNEWYNDLKLKLISFLSSDSILILDQAISTYFKFIEENGKFCIKKGDKKELFPVTYLEQLVSDLLRNEQDLKVAIMKLQPYLEYDDVKFFLMKTIKKTLKSAVLKDLTENYLTNCFTIMKCFHFKEQDNTEEANLFCFSDEKISNFKYNLLESKKLYRSMWMTFLKIKLPTKLYRRVLFSLNEKVIPFMDSPLLLTDFLMDSYNKGGVCSILALNGIFVLMLKYNLEFPDFYKNLYALFKPQIFYTKYRARFINLSNLFLSSSHLPGYLVAAFAKRISRLSLTAPTPSLLLIIRFVQNLFIRHPGLIKMINDQKSTKEFELDPFISDEPDPTKCNAINSSLWEIKDLQNHYNPDVALAAKFIDKPPRYVECDITNLLENSVDEMLLKENRRLKHVKDVPLNHKKLKINSFECLMGNFWMPNQFENVESDLV